MTAEIQTSKLFKSYPDGTEALKGVSLEISRIQIFPPGTFSSEFFFTGLIIFTSISIVSVAFAFSSSNKIRV